MLPVGQAMETSGLAASIASWLGATSSHLPAWSVVALLLIGTMLLTDAVNNAAAAVLMAPIAWQLSLALEVSVDPMLMAVAIGASGAFLTPIGHQSNTLVMGPGGYRFGDYWRLGLPVQIIVALAAFPLILIVWPL